MSARLVGVPPVEFAAKVDPLAVLMERVVAREEAALAELYKQMSRKILAFAMRHLDDRDVAEGVVVDTMFEVWKGAAKFLKGSSVSTWILGIARHKALDEARRRARYVPLDDVASAMIEDSSASAFEGVAARQTREQLAAAIAKLPAEQRECIHLVFYQELSLAEIAEIQGVPENTVKTRLFHARRKLKSQLGRQAECANDLL